jgi:SNF2 family DNA or RNA helicase
MGELATHCVFSVEITTTGPQSNATIANLRYRTVIAIDDSDDMRDEDSDNVPRSQRKKKVVKNKESKKLRDAALARAAMSQQGSGFGKLPSMISGGDQTGGNIAIWAPESIDPSQHVYLNKALAARLKPHQVEGVRFMWRELTVPDDENGQGCILAHTMGLGKTAQA